MENMSVYGAIKKRKSAKTCKGHKLHTRQKQTVKQNTTLNSGSQNRDIVVSSDVYIYIYIYTYNGEAIRKACSFVNTCPHKNF